MIDSSQFAHDGYDNPRSMPIQPLTRSASNVKLGAFNLKQSQVKSIGSPMYVPLTPDTLLLKDAATGRASPKSSKRKSGSLPGPADENDPYGDDGFDYDGEEDPQELHGVDRPRQQRKGRKSRKASKRNSRTPARHQRNSGLVPAAPGAQDLVLSGDALYLANNPQDPQWGDARVTWRVQDPHSATVVGVQQGNEIRPYKASNGYSVHIVQEGQLTAEEAFEGAQSENSVFTWLLRAGGYLLMAIGLRMVLEPAVVAPQLIPLIGGFVSSIVACGACMASMSVALVFTLITVAVAWFAVRPTLSVTLLAVAGATALFASLFRQKNTTGTANAQKNDSFQHQSLVRRSFGGHSSDKKGRDVITAIQSCIGKKVRRSIVCTGHVLHPETGKGLR